MVSEKSPKAAKVDPVQDKDGKKPEEATPDAAASKSGELTEKIPLVSEARRTPQIVIPRDLPSGLDIHIAAFFSSLCHGRTLRG